MSNFTVLRVEKVKSGAGVRGRAAHNHREHGGKYAHPEFEGLNRYLGAKSAEKAYQKWQALMPEKVRSNAVVALEYVISASPEWCDRADQAQRIDYLNDSLAWLIKRHGGRNIVSACYHHDEKSPHLHVLVVPMDPSGKLNARHFTGGADKLKAMHSEFAAEVGEAHGLVRGKNRPGRRHIPLRDLEPDDPRLKFWRDQDRSVQNLGAKNAGLKQV